MIYRINEINYLKAYIAIGMMKLIMNIQLCKAINIFSYIPNTIDNSKNLFPIENENCRMLEKSELLQTKFS